MRPPFVVPAAAGSWCCTAQNFRAIIRPSKRRPNLVRNMNPSYSDADILTSARMAAGMTSRARRPFPHTTAG